MCRGKCVVIVENGARMEQQYSRLPFPTSRAMRRIYSSCLVWLTKQKLIVISSVLPLHMLGVQSLLHRVVETPCDVIISVPRLDVSVTLRIASSCICGTVPTTATHPFLTVFSY